MRNPDPTWFLAPCSVDFYQNMPCSQPYSMPLLDSSFHCRRDLSINQLINQLNKAQIPLWTQIAKVRRNTKSCRWLSWFVSWTCVICVHDIVTNFTANFFVHCSRLNSIRATQTGLSRTCHGLCRKHLDSQDGVCPRFSWFVSTTFIKTSWFHDLSPLLSATFMIWFLGAPC